MNFDTSPPFNFSYNKKRLSPVEYCEVIKAYKISCDSNALEFVSKCNDCVYVVYRKGDKLHVYTPACIKLDISSYELAKKHYISQFVLSVAIDLYIFHLGNIYFCLSRLACDKCTIYTYYSSGDLALSYKDVFSDPKSILRGHNVNVKHDEEFSIDSIRNYKIIEEDRMFNDIEVTNNRQYTIDVSNERDAQPVLNSKQTGSIFSWCKIKEVIFGLEKQELVKTNISYGHFAEGTLHLKAGQFKSKSLRDKQMLCDFVIDVIDAAIIGGVDYFEIGGEINLCAFKLENQLTLYYSTRTTVSDSTSIASIERLFNSIRRRWK